MEFDPYVFHSSNTTSYGSLRLDMTHLSHYYPLKSNIIQSIPNHLSIDNDAHSRNCSPKIITNWGRVSPSSCQIDPSCTSGFNPNIEWGSYATGFGRDIELNCSGGIASNDANHIVQFGAKVLPMSLNG